MGDGTDLVDFDRKVVLSHVHAGTLGWARRVELTTVHLGFLAAVAGAHRTSAGLRAAPAD